MKYRIVEQEGLFYPEYKCCLIQIRYGRETDVCFRDLREAQWFLDEKTYKPPPPIIHSYP